MAERAHLDAGLCWELGAVQQNKHGNSVCGDSLAVSREGDALRLVLSDGLGSGIQANIASTLTAALLDGMTGRGFPLSDCLRAVRAVLPTTKRHNLAYATFTLLTTAGPRVRLVQYDNPRALFLRDGVSTDYPAETLHVDGKNLLVSDLTLKSGDMLVLFSDGVSEAGRGVTTYSGWDRREMEDYLVRSLLPDDSAREVAASIVSSVQALDLFEFHDDTSVVVLRLRERDCVNLLLGPRDAWEPGSGALRRFFESGGEHAVCGSAAAKAAAEYLGAPLRVLRHTASAALPPASMAEGLELATEGERSFAEAVSAIESYVQNSLMGLELDAARDAAVLLLELLAKQASEVKLHFSAAACPAERAEQVFRLRAALEALGKDVELIFV